MRGLGYFLLVRKACAVAVHELAEHHHKKFKRLVVKVELIVRNSRNIQSRD